MARSTIRTITPCATKRALLSKNSPTVLRYSRPEANEEAFEIAGSDRDIVELIKVITQMLPHSIEWGHSNESIEFDRGTHRGEWRHDLKPIGRIDENLMAHFDQDAIANLGPERADNAAERNNNGR